MFVTTWIKLVFSLCLEQCVNQVICGRIMLIPSIWMCVVEHTKSTMLDSKLNYREYCICLEKPEFTHCSDLETDHIKKSH